MIQIGQKIYSILYGGRHGVVYAIHGEQRPQSVGTIGGVMSVGGNAYFDIAFTNGTESKKLPESILYGVQWKIFPVVVSAEEISAMREFTASETARKEIEEQKKAEEFATSVAALKVDPKYKDLQQTGQGAEYSKLVAINLRRELKTAFPGVKFAVKMDGYDSVNIGWLDGPTKAAAQEITKKYSGGSFDGMEDIYRHSRSPWTSVFGSAKYIFETRQHSVEALTKAVEKVCNDHGWPLIEVKSNNDGGAYLGSHEQNQSRIIFDYLERRFAFAEVAA